MENDLCNIELARLAKEKGFDIAVDNFFINGKSQSDIIFLQYKCDSCFIWQPTLYLLSKWLREKHNIHVVSDCNHSGWFWEICKTNGTTIKQMILSENQRYCISYEEAFKIGLYKALLYI